MAAPKGNKYAKGGKREGAGRPNRGDAKAKKSAAEIARAYIEKHIDPVLKTYRKQAEGWVATRYSKSGVRYEEFCFDAATTRHYIDKVLPPVTKTEHSGSISFGSNVPEDED